ncbi:MAG: SDR family NAD(P)-dependent oxidoreductase, partial [Gammaproteobacteria bacterium]|nr:SDR family NAD(P)-dependent oxidoreductase [Gammaproteobacteria bacterium]
MTDFINKTAFVTGAASGIGLAISRALLDHGTRVMMADINAEG